MDRKGAVKKPKINIIMKERLEVYIWLVVWNIFIRPLPRKFLNNWTTFVYKIFRAKIGRNSVIYNSARVYLPSKLTIGHNSIIGPYTNIYNVDEVRFGNDCVISQYSTLCTASHDIKSKEFSRITKPILVEDEVWVCMNAFIGMGVKLGSRSVVGATASVFSNVEQDNVVGGNPAKFIKKR